MISVLCSMAFEIIKNGENFQKFLPCECILNLAVLLSVGRSPVISHFKWKHSRTMFRLIAASEFIAKSCETGDRNPWQLKIENNPEE